MRKTTLALCVLLCCSAAGYAQTSDTRSRTEGNGNAAANKEGRNITLLSGTQLSGQLQNTIDARKVKVGDQVMLKTTNAIKSEGRTVVNKGARLFGRITEVAQRTKSNNASQIGVLFDRLESGSLSFPIAVTITKITDATANVRNQDVLNTEATGNGSASGSLASSGRSSTASSNGGLIGGVTNSVGSVLGSTTATAGSVLGGTTSTLGNTVNGATGATNGVTSSLGNSLGAIQITESSDASASGSSILSLSGGNLHLEKGTTFNMVLTQSTSASAQKKE